jgi:hypothetical protein
MNEQDGTLVRAILSLPSGENPVGQSHGGIST